jgi:hypothetical protein
MNKNMKEEKEELKKACFSLNTSTCTEELAKIIKIHNLGTF